MISLHTFFQRPPFFHIFFPLLYSWLCYFGNCQQKFLLNYIKVCACMCVHAHVLEGFRVCVWEIYLSGIRCLFLGLTGLRKTCSDVKCIFEIQPWKWVYDLLKQIWCFFSSWVSQRFSNSSVLFPSHLSFLSFLASAHMILSPALISQFTVYQQSQVLPMSNPLQLPWNVSVNACIKYLY